MVVSSVILKIHVFGSWFCHKLSDIYGVGSEINSSEDKKMKVRERERE